MSDEDTAEISKSFEPSKTMKYTQWAVSCFREWRSARNKSARDGGRRLCSVDLLENLAVEDLHSSSVQSRSRRSIHPILCGL